MSGPDGSPSFSKTFDLMVLASYYANTNLPPSVAIALIISAHGTKLMLQAIKSGVFGVHVSDSWAHSESKQRIEVTTIAKPMPGVPYYVPGTVVPPKPDAG